jgi:F0F1-type ATP synthase delta subunit
VAGALVRQAVGPTLHEKLLQEFVGNGANLETHHVELLQQAVSQTDGRLTVEVAYPASDEQQEQLWTALIHTLRRDKGSVKLDFRVEPALVAGIRILVGTIAVDLSLSRMLEELSKKVRPNGET